jgi:hypothetical protein
MSDVVVSRETFPATAYCHVVTTVPGKGVVIPQNHVANQVVRHLSFFVAD